SAPGEGGRCGWMERHRPSSSARCAGTFSRWGEKGKKTGANGTLRLHRPLLLRPVDGIERVEVLAGFLGVVDQRGAVRQPDDVAGHAVMAPAAAVDRQAALVDEEHLV